jgi:Uma2 family endonuclease
MPASVRRRATYEDLLAVPETMVAEIIDGELFTAPRPAVRHARAASRLGIELGGPFDRGKGGPGGWLILHEPELHLHADVLVPDIAGWRRERMPELPETAALEVAPDWLCEVLSPSTQGIDRVEKMAAYAREGVPWIWLVDPIARTLEVFHLENGKWVLRSSARGDAAVRAEPFESFELELAVLWER